MVKAHPVVFAPSANILQLTESTADLTNGYEGYQKDINNAMNYVVANISKRENVLNEYTKDFWSIVATDLAELSASEKKFLDKFPVRPLLAFIDLAEGRVVGLLTGDEIDYTNIVDMYRLFLNAEYNKALGMYELTTPKGEKIPFVMDIENGHMLISVNGELVPRHSLLDMIYVGFDAGVLDRPYLRDWFNKVIKGYTDELIDVGLFALTAVAAVTAIRAKNKKVKIGAASVAAGSGGYVGYRLYDRNKKIKEKQTPQ